MPNTRDWDQLATATLGKEDAPFGVESGLRKVKVKRLICTRRTVADIRQITKRDSGTELTV